MNDVALAVHQPTTSPHPLPEFTVRVISKTELAAGVYGRCFDRLKGHLYVLTVRTRAAGLIKVALWMDQLLMRYSALRLGQHMDTQQRWSPCLKLAAASHQNHELPAELGNRTRATLARETDRDAQCTRERR